MSLSLLLQQCLVHLTRKVCEIGGKWPYSCSFVGSCFQDLLKTTAFLCSSLIILFNIAHLFTHSKVVTVIVIMSYPGHSLGRGVLPLCSEVRANLKAMAMKEYSAFPKAPALLEPYHQIVSCHIQDTHWWGLLPLYRCAVSVFYSHLPQVTRLRKRETGFKPGDLERDGLCYRYTT